MAEILFYDGHCGLCQGFVRFVLKRDLLSEHFLFAPLDGETFRTRIPEAQRSLLPDSVILQTADGQVLSRSRAAFCVLETLGGKWRLLARAFGLLPKSLTDTIYDGIARIRRSLLPPPPRSCPLVPEDLRRRFLP